MKLLPTRSFVLAGAVLIACLILVSNTFAADQSTLPKITGKGIQSLVAKNKGKVVLLHFWATWCPPWADEFPALVKVYTAYKTRGLEVIAVSLNDFSEMQDVMSFVHEQKKAEFIRQQLVGFDVADDLLLFLFGESGHRAQRRLSD
jgi:thiol-disulfide isomerase/thioredoxin